MSRRCQRCARRRSAATAIAKIVTETLSTANAKATGSHFEGLAGVSEVGSGDCAVDATAKRDRHGPISVSPQGGSH